MSRLTAIGYCENAGKKPQQLSPSTAVQTHYPDEIVATAVALGVRGYSLRRIESELRQRFPNERMPDHSTISDWLNNSDLTTALEPQEQRIAHRTGRILEDQLDAVERGDKDISLTQAGVLYGISRDKMFRRNELKQPVALMVVHLRWPPSHMPRYPRYRYRPTHPRTMRSPKRRSPTQGNRAR